jgi:putative Holliday junction resolvase
LTIHRATLRADLKSIARLVRRHEVAAVIVGHPVHLSGEASAQTVKSEAFAAALREHLPGLPIHLVDERLTSAHAHELLDQTSGARRTAADRQRRSAVIDQVAATLILEAWLTGGRPRLLPDPDAPTD